MKLKLFAIILFLLLIPPFSCVNAVTFHVAPGGNDANRGTKKKPFATLERARNEVRKFKHGKPLRETMTIILHGGTYTQLKTLELGPEDSGTIKSPVIWQAATNEQVRLTGGPTLPVKAFHPISYEKVLARLGAEARKNVQQLDLRQFGELQLEDYPETFRGVPAVPELFFNDKRMTVAWWPNSGWTTIAKIIESGSTPREGDKSNRPGIFEYSGDEPSKWNVQAGIWLQGYWCYDWYEETIKVKSIDPRQRQITLAAPALYSVKQGNPSPRRFRALNVLEELDEPGEFYLDRSARVLYFWPPASMDGARVALSTLNAPLLRLKNAEYINIQGLILEACLGDGLELVGGRRIQVENCTVRNTRQLGIHVTGGSGHRIENCDITDTGTGGLVLEGGDRRTLVAAGHEALNNHIWNFSRHQLTSAYGIVLGGVGNRAAHNFIHDAPHQAICLNGNDHVFEFNTVSNVVKETDDAGALYKGRNPSCRGNIIRYNFWTDIGSPMGHGTAAIYFDDGDGGDLVFGNIFVRCGFPGFGSFGTVFSHGGHDLRAENNIFVDCKRPLGSVPWDDQRWKDAIDGGQDCYWQTKLLEEVNITKPPYTTHYPELVNFMNPKPGQPRNSFASNNVLIRYAEVSSGNWKYADDQNFLTDKDPGFVDAAVGNYELRSDAEVFKRLPKFKPIPFQQIGLQGRR
ncbi:MAG: hypothetical protein JWQ71_3108 [Pedosphaera sp.]|nr:hypothetical protein [Pedosphaera sp.]